MKLLVSISRIIVGILFIFSGLIKLNDPIGVSFKLAEYFSPAVLNLAFLEPYVLPLAIILVVLEVLLGVFLLLGYKAKFTVWSLFGLIVFFTFLTFYSAYFNKVTDCGCFGDAIKLTPWQSFAKDAILLTLIVILLKGLKFITPIFSRIITLAAVFLSFIGSLWIAYYVLLHLPIIDFRPYNVGANLIDNMTVPENAAKPVVEYAWKFNVNGEAQVIVTEGSYPSVEGEFIGVETEVISEGYQPPIHDFLLERNGEVYTESLLRESKLLMIVAYNLSNSELNGLVKLKGITNRAKQNGYKVIVLTASGEDVANQISSTYNLDAEFYYSDETVLKTIVRSNPGILRLHSGTVVQKLHWYDAEQLKFD